MADYDEIMKRARDDYGKPLPIKKQEVKKPTVTATKPPVAAAKKPGGFRELGKALSDLSPKKAAMRQGMKAYVDRQQQAKDLEKDL